MNSSQNTNKEDYKKFLKEISKFDRMVIQMIGDDILSLVTHYKILAIENQDYEYAANLRDIERNIELRRYEKYWISCWLKLL